MAEQVRRPYMALAVSGAVGFGMGYLFVSLFFPADSLAVVLVGAFFGLTWAGVAFGLQMRSGEFLSFVFLGRLREGKQARLRSQHHPPERP